jgi:HAD superfamily hydrolase (TIGR01490 family)
LSAPRLALFDLDGTLLAGDTDELWCQFLIDEGIVDRATFSAANRDIAERYATGAITPAEFCAFYAATLAGRSAAGWAPLRARFVATAIVPRLGAAAIALVAKHRDAGDRIVLTTATNRFLTELIAERLGIADLIATELEVVAGIFTGRNAGVLNMRDGKVTRLKAWLAAETISDTSLASATFYSDSINDLPLLSVVSRPVAVDPDARLKAEALRLSWTARHRAGERRVRPGLPAAEAVITEPFWAVATRARHGGVAAVTRVAPTTRRPGSGTKRTRCTARFGGGEWWV